MVTTGASDCPVPAGAPADSPIARRRWQAEIEAGLAASGIPHTLLLAERSAFRLRLVAVRYRQVRIEDGIEVVASDRLAGRLGMVRRS